MRPQGSFVAERLAAQHCAGLLRTQRQGADPLAGLADFGDRLAQALHARMAQLFPWARLEANVGEAVEMPANINEPRGGPVFNSALSVGLKESAFHASLPVGLLVSLVDVALGGTGRESDAAGSKPPLSAQLMYGRVEKVLLAALAEAFELPESDEIRLRGTSGAPETGMPFAGCKRTVLPVRLAIAEAAPCDLVLTFPGTSATALFAAREKPAGQASRGGVVAPNAEPFGGIPLQLKAVLVDMPMSVSILSRLQPGMVIPVSIARNVPLFAGDQVIAHGTIGSLDDRKALQLNKILSSKEK